MILDELHKEIEGHGIEYRGFDLIFLSQVYIAEHALGNYRSYKFNALLKRISLENLAKCLRSPKTKFPRDHDSVLFFNEVNNASMINILNRVYDEVGQSKIMVSADPRLIKETGFGMFTRGSAWDYLTSMFIGFGYLGKAFKGGSFKSFRKRYRINRIGLWLNMIDSIFMIRRIKKLQQANRFNKILLNTDVHKLSRILVLNSRTSETPTAVVQHGATVLAYGYLPVSAARFYSWGEVSRNWLIDKGADPDKIIAAGAPSMDDVRFERSEVHEKPIDKVLVALNPIGEELNRKFLDLIMKALLGSNVSEVVLKLHPGTDDNSEIAEEVLSMHRDSRFRIVKTQPIHELLNKSDLVITTTSSVSVEAVLFNKPIIEIRMDELRVNSPIAGFDLAHEVYNSEGLKNVISSLSLLYRNVKKYPSFIDQYFGSLDGNAANRIAVDFLGL